MADADNALWLPVSGVLKREESSIYLFTAITLGRVLELPSRGAASHNQLFQTEVAVRHKLEGVRRVVPVLVPQETTETQVIILAFVAPNHVGGTVLCLELALYQT